MYHSNIPFGFSNNCGPVGCTPFSGIGAYNNWCGDSCSPINCSPVSGWNYSPYAGINTPNFVPGFNTPNFVPGFNTPGFVPGLNIPSFVPGLNTPSFVPGINTPYAGFSGFNALNSLGGFPGYGIPSNQLVNGLSNCSPIGVNHGLHAAGLHPWSSVPFAGLGHQNWNSLALNAQYASPLSCNVPFNGMHQGVGFTGMNLNSASTGYNTPWTNWAGCSPVNAASPFVGASPISGVSNWFNSPFMSAPYTAYNQQYNAPVNGKPHFASPINAQYIPGSAYPVNCAPFSVPFPTTGYAPINGYAPVGQGVNCEAA